MWTKMMMKTLTPRLLLHGQDGIVCRCEWYVPLCQQKQQFETSDDRTLPPGVFVRSLQRDDVGRDRRQCSRSLTVCITKIMQGLRIIFFSNHFNFTVFFYPHQLIGIFPESFFMNARPEAERRISTFNFPFLFFGLGKSSVNHGFLFLFVMFCLRAC